jgi:adenylate kinase
MRLLLIGAPGSGKGTQARRTAVHFDLAVIATGELLRGQVAAGTEVGRAAEQYIDRGDLVPDELVIPLVRQRILEAAAEGGYVLDGYPRTLAQAEDGHRWAIARGVRLDLALSFEIGQEELLARLTARARKEDRSDDTQATMRHRLEVFQTETLPLLDYYERRGILVRIDAVGPVDAVTERILAELHSHRADVLSNGAGRPA